MGTVNDFCGVFGVVSVGSGMESGLGFISVDCAMTLLVLRTIIRDPNRC